MTKSHGEVSITLRGFEADPSDLAFSLSASSEVRRKGERINSVSEAIYRDNSVRITSPLSGETHLDEAVELLVQLWGSWSNVARVIKQERVERVEIDALIVAKPDDNLNFAISQATVHNLSELSASFAFTVDLQ